VTAFVVVAVGVEQAIVLAVVLSVIDHLRHSYQPNDSVVVVNAAGHAKSAPVAAGTMTRPGVIVYTFAADLYYANANRLHEEILELVGDGPPDVGVFVLDAGTIFDVDYTGGETLKHVCNELRDRGVRLLLADVSPEVRTELDRYGVTDLLDESTFFDTPGEALAAVTDPTP
jgi:SulP family sulfate permease